MRMFLRLVPLQVPLTVLQNPILQNPLSEEAEDRYKTFLQNPAPQNPVLKNFIQQNVSQVLNPWNSGRPKHRKGPKSEGTFPLGHIHT